MPDAETQTEDFVLLCDEDLKKLSLVDRKKYKLDLKIYKRKIAKEKKTIYMRTYMNNYSKMKTKYDPAFRARKIINDQTYTAKRRLLREQEKQEEQEEQEEQEQQEEELFKNNFMYTAL